MGEHNSMLDHLAAIGASSSDRKSAHLGPRRHTLQLQRLNTEFPPVEVAQSCGTQGTQGAANGGIIDRRAGDAPGAVLCGAREQFEPEGCSLERQFPHPPVRLARQPCRQSTTFGANLAPIQRRRTASRQTGPNQQARRHCRPEAHSMRARATADVRTKFAPCG